MYEVKITVGIGEDKDRRCLPHHRVIKALDHAKLLASRSFGGCTCTAGEGAWCNPEGKLVEERCHTLSAIADYGPDTVLSEARKIADYLKYRLNQEAVLVTITALEKGVFV